MCSSEEKRAAHNTLVTELNLLSEKKKMDQGQYIAAVDESRRRFAVAEVGAVLGNVAGAVSQLNYSPAICRLLVVVCV